MKIQNKKMKTKKMEKMKRNKSFKQYLNLKIMLYKIGTDANYILDTLNLKTKIKNNKIRLQIIIGFLESIY